jgi:hypothetical protein
MAEQVWRPTRRSFFNQVAGGIYGAALASLLDQEAWG